MSAVKKFVYFSKVIVLLILLGVLAAGAGLYWWAVQPMPLPAKELDVTIKPHSSLRLVAQQIRAAGVPMNPRLFELITRIKAMSTSLKSGNYAFETGITPYELLLKVGRGDVNQFAVTVIEGWNVARMREEMDANPALKHDSFGMSGAQLLAAISAPAGGDAAASTSATPSTARAASSIGASSPSTASPTLPVSAAADAAPTIAGVRSAPATSAAADLGAVPTPNAPLEGLFFPDTYLFPKGTSDLDIFRRAYHVGQQRLNDIWQARAPGLPLKTPYDALILASLVEKETGVSGERGQVAAVFVNRLRIGMPLQTDPSVIYGLTGRFEGRLRKKDLQTDTPYNTYTRKGLPPTPISMPGMASLEAATHPASTPALYFVARGDGTSIFSNSLDAHNRAVNEYQRGSHATAR